MNEANIENKPVEDEAMLFDFKDIESDTSVEDTTQPTETEVDKPVETSKEDEVDYSPFLNKIKEKAIYNDEPIELTSLDEAIDYIEKGKNLDKTKEKLRELEESPEMSYIKEKAEENGLTPKQFIELVKRQEQDAKEQAYKDQYEDLIESGVPEELVKDMISKLKKTDELEKEVNILKRDKQEQQEEKNKDARYKDFVKAYPDVKLEELPKEVITSPNIKEAYLDYQNKKLLQEIVILKQNKEAGDKNPVKNTTEHGGVATEQEDDFIKGLFGK